MNGLSFSTLMHFAGMALSGTLPFIGIAFLILMLIYGVRFLGWLNRGNSAKYNPDKLNMDEASPLNGKNLIFLGSSVTEGFMSCHKSFVDMIAAHTGAHCVKEAVSGTTLVDKGKGKSYVERLNKLDPKLPCDVFVCQLSTNDATFKSPIGSISETGEFDTKTVSGAIEYIISYVKKTWGCPIVFYTNPQYLSAAYYAMYEQLLKIAKKWEVPVIDLWSNSEVNTKEHKKRAYMNDHIHPTKKGYQLWAPIIEKALVNTMAGKPLDENKTQIPTADEVKKAEKKRKRKSVRNWILVVLLAMLLGVGCSSVRSMMNGFGSGKAGNNDKYNPEYLTAYENSPLEGKTILCVGSSVTQGWAAKNISFVDYIAKLDSANTIKEVYPGTTVATQNENSYYPRLLTYTAEDPIDAVVIQLSSNDSSYASDLGEIGTGMDLDSFDDTTFAGGMESMICYVKQTWNCPVLVYSDPQFRVRNIYNVEAYDAMVQVTEKICEKWNVNFLNMWDDPEVNSIPLKEYKFYMSDVVHPTKAGYLEWWTPMFEAELYQMLAD